MSSTEAAQPTSIFDLVAEVSYAREDVQQGGG